MNPWTKQRLDQMIADGVEESLNLEYKGAGSLAKTDRERLEITKDVSAFANSAGGVLIYGVAEYDEAAKRHLPERLDPVVRAEFSREWLDQVIQTIQPHIEGVVIHPVTIDEQAGAVCYVVEVPQSGTAHQARDHKYYKRHNFNAVPMEDYEVRDAMNRRKHPRIRGSVIIKRRIGRIEDPYEGLILVKLENVGQVMARFVMVDLRIPVDLNGLIFVEKPVNLEHGDDGSCFAFRLAPEPLGTPLFPGAEIVLRKPFTSNVQELKRHDGKPILSARDVRARIFADEMPAISAVLAPGAVLSDWTEIGGGAAPAA